MESQRLLELAREGDRRKVKVVILAGGLGTRLSEETDLRPKPMVEIGGKPILWHIMKHYSHYGFNEFVIALGYKGEVIKRYFVDLYNLNGSITVNFPSKKISSHSRLPEDWKVYLVDTGLYTPTGGRIKNLQDWIGNERFMLTYGDGLSNVDLPHLLSYHKTAGRIGTVTAVHPQSRFGEIISSGTKITQFNEKPQISVEWINGGFMVFEPEMIWDIKEGDSLEADILPLLAKNGQLTFYPHSGFWQCMDTLREKKLLEDYWNTNEASWKVWED